MENRENKPQYTIEINSKVYSFSCDDGEEHVELLKRKLKHELNRLSLTGKDQSLSDMAMKLGLLLADDSARYEIKYRDMEKTLNERLGPLLDDLEKVLDTGN